MKESLINFPQAQLVESDSDRIDGSLNLCKGFDGVYLFEFLPHDKKQKSKSIYFNQITNMTKVYVSFNEIKVIVSRVGGSDLDFFFDNTNLLILQHLFEYLVNCNIIDQCYMIDKKESYKTVSWPSKYAPSSTDNMNQKGLLASHDFILNNLNYKSDEDEEKPVSYDEFIESSRRGSDIKREIYLRGLNEDERYKIWPILLGLYDYSDTNNQIEEKLNNLCSKYSELKEKYSLVTEKQMSFSESLRGALNSIENDVVRNDRTTNWFRDINGPNMILLKNVLRQYALYNMDVMYVQGMGDIVSMFIMLFINKWSDSDFVFPDGSKRSHIQTESFIFWCLVKFFDLTHQKYLFAFFDDYLNHLNQKIIKIVFELHKPFKRTVKNTDIESLTFLCSHHLLLYKRSFKKDFVFRLWDTIISSPDPGVFIRFFSSSVLILVYPNLCTSSMTFHDTSSVLNSALKSLNISSVLRLTNSIIEEIKKKGKYDEVSAPFDLGDQLKEYKPKYLKLK